MDTNSVNKMFFDESRDNISKIENSLLHLENEPKDNDMINELFRNVHTIKGSSGMFGFDNIMEFTHTFETLLDKVRHDEILITDEIISESLKANDYISKMLDLAENNEKVTNNFIKDGNQITTKLQQLSSSINEETTSAESKQLEGDEELVEINSEGVAATPQNVKNIYWHISLRFHENVFQYGLDPFAFIAHLENDGQIISIVPITENIPNAENYDAEKCYLGFEIVYDTKMDKNSIANIFEFVIDDCDIIILPPQSDIAYYMNLINNLKEPIELMGEILVAAGALTQNELNQAIKIQNKLKEEYVDGEDVPLIGDIIVEEKMVQPSVIDAVIKKQQEIKKVVEKKNRSMRIDVAKIDQMIRSVGELVIATAGLKQLSSEKNYSSLDEVSNSISRLVEDIRDNTMSVRMIPIGETFNSFKRTVRDLSKSVNKTVDLEIYGGDTELDKTLIEKIQDPIMHLVRNSIDHGIENSDERIAMGKPANGKIVLNAYYESGSVAIEVNDDGKGLNREKILEKAYEKGLISGETELSDKAVWDLIFSPGFSTAKEISNVSGRGVGMDVVRSNVESLRGIIDVDTQENVGTTFRMNLPLTLAIIDGFLIDVGGMNYIVPLEMVVECLEITEEIKLERKAGNFFSIRGEVTPFINLKDFFSCSDNDSDSDINISNVDNIIIVKYAKKTAGLIVDQLLGKFQAVIKPLGKLFDNLKWISGATILGNGSVAMILDVPRLIQHVQNNKVKIGVEK